MSLFSAFAKEIQLNNSNSVHDFVAEARNSLIDWCYDVASKSPWQGRLVGPFVIFAENLLVLAGKVQAIFECIIKGTINILTGDMIGLKQLGMAVLHGLTLVTAVPVYILINSIFSGIMVLFDPEFIFHIKFNLKDELNTWVL